MKNIKHILTGFMLLTASILSFHAIAEVSVATPAVSGYDVKSFFSDTGPVKGDGSFVSEYNGGTYLFALAENKSTIESDPEKNLPALRRLLCHGCGLWAGSFMLTHWHRKWLMAPYT